MEHIYLNQIKPALLSLCILAFTAINLQTKAQDITSGLKLYYSFEGFTGMTIPDVSGNSLTGTITGNATLKTGFSGLGLLCTAKADHIDLPKDINAGLKSFTFATWAYFNSVNGATRFFDWGNIAGDNNPDDFLCFMPNSGSGYARMRYRTTGGAVGINCDATSVKTPSGRWAHFAVTFDWNEGTATGKATIYIDGVAAGTADYANFNPSLLGNGTTQNNFIAASRWAQDTNGLNAILDEIRLYNRALSADDITALFNLSSKDLMLQNGYTQALISAQENLTIEGDLNAVSAPLALPQTADGGISITWKSSNPAVVDSLGKINRPDQYNATVKLTATLTQIVDGKTYSLTKDFTVVVLAFNEAGYQLAKWDFTSENIFVEGGEIKVNDESESKFVATLKNEASIRTIGETNKFNVLDLGNGTGYMDMGTAIGKAVYSLNNYTVCGFFRIDDSYEYLNSNGNFYWTFSNTADAMNDPTGYFIGSLKNTSQSIASGRYDQGNQAVGLNQNAPKGGWHHFAFTQNGTTAITYLDGVPTDTATITNLPSQVLQRAGREGTLYNWLGRSNYTGDVYLRKTLLYDFQLWRDAMTPDDLNYELNIAEVINNLDNAYTENPNAVLPELAVEQESLNISGLDAITTDVVLPNKGIKDPAITINWKSNHNEVIAADGKVTRPDYFPAKVKLTATIIKNGQSLSKEFIANVIEKPGTAFTGNLLLKHDFTNVKDTVVTDVAEKKLSAILKNKAAIRTIGTTKKFNTLDLTDSTAYLDLGPEVGKIMYNLSDYTMSCYYRIDSTNTHISNAGNFLWTFANSAKTGTDMNGCLFGGLRSQTMAIAQSYWKTGEQVVSAGVAASTGSWHNMTYTQKDTIGTLYIDGMPTQTGTIKWLPSNTLVLDNRSGTISNWLGRSCYVGDEYLTKTLIYDFRIYNKALSDEEIQATELNVGSYIAQLDAAYAENPNNPSSLKNADNSNIRIFNTGSGIRITGLTGKEEIKLFDISGRNIIISNPSEINLGKGIYLIRVDNSITKILVR